MERVWKHGKAIGAMFALSFAISIFLLLLLPQNMPRMRLTELAANILVGMTYGLSIGALSWIAMSFLARRIMQLHPVPRWIVLTLLFALCAAAGAFAAVFIVSRVYQFGPNRALLPLWLGSLRTCLALTIPMGAFVTILETFRHRLRDTEVRLRDKELERERAIKLATEAQLAALTARVEPHFLFNTLNTISSLIREDPDRAERTIEQLSALLRSSLDTANTPVIPLDQEMRLVSSYLQIQATRFGDRLRFSLASSGGLEHCTVPPFSIQTLVENSVKFAVAPRREGGAIHVRLQQEPGRLLVDIEDDGPGFTPQEIPAGHGIDNLQGRLRTLYGPASALEFIRTPGLMRVRMSVPI